MLPMDLADKAGDGATEDLGLALIWTESDGSCFVVTIVVSLLSSATDGRGSTAIGSGGIGSSFSLFSS